MKIIWDIEIILLSKGHLDGDIMAATKGRSPGMLL